MTILVTGAGGQLGRAMRALLPDARFAASSEVDITDLSAVRSAVDRATGVINAAAFTAVDAAEDPQNVERAFAVNATGVAHLAHACRQRDIPLIHLSTDYVLAGTHAGDAPRDAPLQPAGVYAASKAAGELAARLAPRHHVVRTSWVFGDGPNFVRTMLRLAGERTELTVVADQVGRPTYAPDLAAAVTALLDSTAYGLHHATGGGEPVSWADFARVILADSDVRVRDTTTEAYGAPAPRPANSALACDLVLRDWREALADYLALERSGV